MRRLPLRAGLLFLAAFGLYLASLYPTLAPYRDSGDMAASAYTLGVAHPPGYPLYVLTGKLGSVVLPFASPAYRANVLSALFGAGAVTALYLLLAGLLGEGPWGLLCACLAVSPAFWALAQVSEMYSLNALFAALILLCWPREPGEAGSLELCGLLYGLGLANHQTLVLTLPASLALFWRARLPPRRWAHAAGFFILGLGLYLFLPIRSSTFPAVDWGAPRTWRGLWRVLVRADYGGLRLHPERAPQPLSSAAFLDGLGFAARSLWTQAGALLFVAAAGLFGAAAWDWGAFSAFLLSGPAFVLLASLDPAKPESPAILEPHLVLPLVFLLPLAGRALARLRTLGPRAGPLGAAVLAAACAAWTLKDSAALKFHRDDFAVTDYARGLLASLPPRAVLVDPDDPTAFTLSYLEQCQRLRPDVVKALYLRTRWGYESMRRLHPDLLPDKELASAQELFAALLQTNIERGLYADLPQKFPPGWPVLVLGQAYKLLTPSEARSAAKLLDDALLRAELSRYRDSPRTREFFTRHAYSYGASAFNNLGIQLMSAGRLDEAERLYQKALAVEPELSEGWSNRGNIRFKRGKYAEAVSLYRQALAFRDTPQYRYNLARALWAAGQDGEARKEYEAAFELPDARNDIGLMDFRAGRVDSAVGLWRALAEDVPGYAPVRYNLGMAYEQKGDKRRAREYYAAFRALSSSPEDRAEAEERLGRLKP